jgi:hypothetical protein
LARQEGLLGKGINIFWMNYMMQRRLAFSEDSAIEAIQSLQNPSNVLPHQPFITAALLNGQIKALINLLLKEYIGDFFGGLEWRLRNSRTSWAICFCANIILCMLVEQVQIAIDAIVVDKISSSRDAADTRKGRIESCQALEELPMKYSWTLYSGIQRKYNRIKYGCLAENNSAQNDGEAGLVNNFRKLISDHGIGFPKISAS